MAGPYKLSKVIGMKMTGDMTKSFRSKSQKLFIELGLLKMNNGLGTLSPLLVKSLKKLENLVHITMEEVAALEIQLPTIAATELLKKSGRDNLPDLFKLDKINGKDYYLNPTCEELMTELIATSVTLSHKQLPYRFYQITNKFRDEKRPKSGLFRSKEFIMKDLYTFDADEKSNQSSYNEIKNKYHDFFKCLQVPYVCVKGTQENFGGSESDEFHYISDAGDDELLMCQDCGHKENLDSLNSQQNVIAPSDISCPNCKGKNINIAKGIEVGHTFNLGTRYTKPFEATYLNKNGNHELLHMNCFGLGLTRILAASVEVTSSDTDLRWPLKIAPYLLCIIPPKAGSKEEKEAADITKSVVDNMYEWLGKEMIVDDRVSMTVGKRLKSVLSLGIPYVVIIGKNINEKPPLVEVHDVNENVTKFVPVTSVMQFFKEILSDKSVLPNSTS